MESPLIGQELNSTYCTVGADGHTYKITQGWLLEMCSELEEKLEESKNKKKHAASRLY